MTEAVKRHRSYTPRHSHPFDTQHFSEKCASKGALTLGQQAELLGCNRNTVWRTITGRTRLTTDMAMHWARVLGTTVDRLHGVTRR